MKLLSFLRLLARRPTEVVDRFEGFFDTRLSRTADDGCGLIKNLSVVLDNVERVLGLEVSAYLSSPGLAKIENHVSAALDQLHDRAPFPRVNNGDFVLARLCYALCRATRPSCVLETGVCYGVTSAFLLMALQENGGGVLHSVDLPPLGARADEYVGILVPTEIRSRWKLHRGASKRVLPKLLKHVPSVDCFVHDSLHTYRNMSRELNLVTRALSRPAVLVADDVDNNPAFREWSTRTGPSYWAIVEETKASCLGVAVFA